LIYTTMEDINKYYRADLAAQVTSILGIGENPAWINQSYQKLLSYTSAAVELKNARSLVRFKEIKKTLQEQKLSFLQGHAKEIEDILN